MLQLPSWGIKSPPFGIACLSAYLKERGYKVTKRDLNIEIYTYFTGSPHEKLWNLNTEFWGDWEKVSSFVVEHNALFNIYIDEILASKAKLIGFSILWSTEMMSRLFAQEIKKRDRSRIIVFGGPHCARDMAGERIAALPEVDYVVDGEGEETLYELAKTIEGGEDIGTVRGVLYKKDGDVIWTGERSLISDLDTLPLADLDDFNFALYPDPMVPISTARGCPNKCIYCDEKRFWRIFRNYSGKRIFNEMQYQYRRHKISKFEFVDSLVNGNIKALEEFCDLVIDNKLPIGWMGQAVVRKEMSRELLQKIKYSGCFHFCFGMEHSSEKLMLKMGKLLCEGADCDTIVKNCYEVGLGIGLNWMFGFPGETDKDFQEDLNFFTINQKYLMRNASINNSPGFCGFTSGCFAYDHPDEVGIILGPDPCTWKTKDGKNTYVKRLLKFQKFCRHLDKLNISHSFPAHSNENELIAKYYFLVKNYLLAARYLKISLNKEGATVEKLFQLFDIYSAMGRKESILKCNHEFEKKFSNENDKRALNAKIKCLLNESSI